MDRLRDRAIARKARKLSRDVRQLERISRDQPQVSRLAGEARRCLAAAELQAESVDCTITSCDEDELHRRACSGDEDALAEWCRRGVTPLAA